MHELVALINSQPLTDTLAIADGIGNQHKNVISMVRQYRDDLEEFGRVAFETRMGEPLPQGGFGKATEYALLNERQATLLMSYMKNTDVVRGFKMRLVKAFFSMAEALKARQEPQAFMAPGQYPLLDRPTAVNTPFGIAYINMPTMILLNNARWHPGGPASKQLLAALTVRTEHRATLPEPYRSMEKLRRAMLKQNPLWSDILQCQRMGISQADTARVCGCHASTVRRHLRKMEECGLLDMAWPAYDALPEEVR